jgi:hypothetical protein
MLKLWKIFNRGNFKLRVFENRVLRRIFGPKRDEVTGGWRKLRNEERTTRNLKRVLFYFAYLGKKAKFSLYMGKYR